MGQVEITGRDRILLVNRVQTAAVEQDRGALGLILNSEAGIMDDCITTVLADKVLMVVNSGNKYTDLEHMLAVAK